jgi:hypothetical protein
MELPSLREWLKLCLLGPILLIICKVRRAYPDIANKENEHDDSSGQVNRSDDKLA